MALAWAGLSNAYSAKTGFGTEFAEGFAKARAAAEKAIELDADLADGYLALARVQMSYDWDWSGADTSLRRANALRPGDPDIFVELATLSRIRGDSVGAFDGIEQALEQDPLNTALVRIHIGMLVSLGRIEEALEKAVFLARATPERGGVHASLAGIHRRSGNLDQALEAAEKESFLFLRLQHEAIIYHEMGEQDTAQEKLQELIDTFGDDVSWQVATVYANWGDKDETVAAIERGIAVRDPGVIYIQMNTRIVDLLQDDPRYDELLKKINLR
jgi:tetratricopeptide (TPR) repeat protein